MYEDLQESIKIHSVGVYRPRLIDCSLSHLLSDNLQLHHLMPILNRGKGLIVFEYTQPQVPFFVIVVTSRVRKYSLVLSTTAYGSSLT